MESSGAGAAIPHLHQCQPRAQLQEFAGFFISAPSAGCLAQLISAAAASQMPLLLDLNSICLQIDFVIPWLYEESEIVLKDLCVAQSHGKAEVELADSAAAPSAASSRNIQC